MNIIVKIKGNNWSLLPERAMYWVEKKTLVAGDLHLGKSGHFRKSGIAAPQQINLTNLSRLDTLVSRFEPDRILLLGDLFHSDYNREWFSFEEWCKKYPSLKKILITGNHDSLHRTLYEEAGISTYPRYTEGPFQFKHHPEENDTETEFFRFCGHVHPGIRLKGRGRQSVRIPCFYQSLNQMILPAFGEFTGLHLLETGKATRLYGIADGQVVELKQFNY